jgi:hypothetical protein
VFNADQSDRRKTCRSGNVPMEKPGTSKGHQFKGHGQAKSPMKKKRDHPTQDEVDQFSAKLREMEDLAEFDKRSDVIGQPFYNTSLRFILAGMREKTARRIGEYLNTPLIRSAVSI